MSTATGHLQVAGDRLRAPPVAAAGEVEGLEALLAAARLSPNRFDSRWSACSDAAPRQRTDEPLRAALLQPDEACRDGLASICDR
jgi:hypothetical protein